MKKFFSLATAFVIMSVVASCKKDADSNIAIPGCVQSAVDSALAQPKGTLYLQVDAYKYQDKTVYLFYAGCCDRFNPLKDPNCNYLFAPSGGFTGMGDLSHPNFFGEAVKLSTIWKDPRN